MSDKSVNWDSLPEDWFLAQSNRAEHLLDDGLVAEAEQLFRKILEHLGKPPSYEQAVTLRMLGRCFRTGGLPALALQYQRKALAVLDTLESSDSIKRERAVCLTDRGDALRHLGHYAKARQAYNAGLEIMQELNYLIGEGISHGQLGTLACMEGKIPEAIERYRSAIALFHSLPDPSLEATYLHQLARVYQETGDWDTAELHYRKSAGIHENLGLLMKAASTWNNLAVLNQNAGKPEVAEVWFRKALEVNRSSGNPKEIAIGLTNLANLLKDQPGRLAEAKRWAKDALNIDQTLDPGAAEIWNIYHILAQIADREAEAFAPAAEQIERRQAARNYRRLALDAYRAVPDSRTMLQQCTPLILAAVAACSNQDEAYLVVNEWQATLRQSGPEPSLLADALDRLLAGERGGEALCAGLRFDAALILETILQGLVEPGGQPIRGR